MARPLVERLHQLTVPTRLLWGEHDEWIPAPTAVALAEAIPGAELHFIPDAGHFSPEDNPASFGDAVLAFTQKVGSGNPPG